MMEKASDMPFLPPWRLEKFKENPFQGEVNFLIFSKTYAARKIAVFRLILFILLGKIILEFFTVNQRWLTVDANKVNINAIASGFIHQTTAKRSFLQIEPGFRGWHILGVAGSQARRNFSLVGAGGHTG